MQNLDSGLRTRLYGLIFGWSSGPMWSSIPTDNRCLDNESLVWVAHWPICRVEEWLHCLQLHLNSMAAELLSKTIYYSKSIPHMRFCCCFTISRVRDDVIFYSAIKMTSSCALDYIIMLVEGHANRDRKLPFASHTVVLTTP